MSYEYMTGRQGLVGKLVVSENPKDHVTDFQGGVELAGATIKVKKIALNATTHCTGAEVDTGWDLPETSVVLDCFINVTTLATGTTKTLDVGTLSTESDGDADGFLDGANLLLEGLVTAINTAGAITLGELLSDAPSTTAAVGRSKVNYSTHTGTARSVSVTSGSTDVAAFVGDLYILYLVIE